MDHTQYTILGLLYTLELEELLLLPSKANKWLCRHVSYTTSCVETLDSIDDSSSAIKNREGAGQHEPDVLWTLNSWDAELSPRKPKDSAVGSWSE